MKWKTTSQAVAEQMAKEMGITKRSAEQFSRTFIDTLVAGLQRDGVVKIKGFGTFKLVSISSRESVNVTTGERMVIAEHKKVSFTPSEEITTQLTNLVSNTNAPQASTEQQTQSIEDTTFTPEKSQSTQSNKANNFDGIDDIIATPESEISQTESNSTAHPKGEEERTTRLSPHIAQPTPSQEISAQQTPTHTPANEASKQDTKTGEPDTPTQNPKQDVTKATEEKHKKKKHAYTIAFLIILLLLLTYCIFPLHKKINTHSSKQDSPKVETPKNTQTPAQQSESQPQKAQTPQKTKKDSTAERQPSRPKTYILQKGQSITDVSVLFYGTKDSMQAIIRANNFRNPNNVFVGTEIKLP